MRYNTEWWGVELLADTVEEFVQLRKLLEGAVLVDSYEGGGMEFIEDERKVVILR